MWAWEKVGVTWRFCVNSQAETGLSAAQCHVNTREHRANPRLKLTTVLNAALLLFPTGQAASLWSTVVSFSSQWDHPCGEYQHCEPHLTLSCPCLNTEIVFNHIVVGCFLLFFCHNAAAWKLPQDSKISVEKGGDQFLREPPPTQPPTLLSLLVSLTPPPPPHFN